MKSVLSLISPKSILFFAVYIIFLSGSLFAGEASCNGITDGQTHYGTIDGVCWAYHCVGGMNKLGSVSSSYCQACPSGQVKYTPQGSCNTCMQTCCTDGSWSGCNTACPDPSDCPSTQCWNGSKCVDKPTGSKYWGRENVFYNGTCYYTCGSWTCNKGRGWDCTKKDGVSVQDGKWSSSSTYSFQNRYSTTTTTGIARCSTRVDASENAVISCSRQGASVRGIPYEVMSENGVIHDGSCFIESSCKCSNTSTQFYNISEASRVCNFGFTCTAKVLSCSKKTYSC